MDRHTAHGHRGQSREFLELHRILFQLSFEVNTMSDQSDRLIASVTRIRSAADAMAAVLADVKTRLDAAIAAGNDPALLAQLSADLDTESDEIVAATLANTPASTP